MCLVSCDKNPNLLLLHLEWFDVVNGMFGWPGKSKYLLPHIFSHTYFFLLHLFSEFLVAIDGLRCAYEWGEAAGFEYGDELGPAETAGWTGNEWC